MFELQKIIRSTIVVKEWLGPLSVGEARFCWRREAVLLDGGMCPQ